MYNYNHVHFCCSVELQKFSEDIRCLSLRILGLDLRRFLMDTVLHLLGL